MQEMQAALATEIKWGKTLSELQQQAPVLSQEATLPLLTRTSDQDFKIFMQRPPTPSHLDLRNIFSQGPELDQIFKGLYKSSCQDFDRFSQDRQERTLERIRQDLHTSTS